MKDKSQRFTVQSIPHISPLLLFNTFNKLIFNPIAQKNKFSVVNQFYNPGIMETEYVMKNNAILLKCAIPSFVADFVSVIAWIDDVGGEYTLSNDYSESN